MKFIFRRRRGLPKVLPPKLSENLPVPAAKAPEGDTDGLFKVPANTRLWRTSKQAPSYAGEVTKLYREVFTPSHPKQTIDDFTGRAETITRITQSIEEEQTHILLLGPRLMGKTSLLNVVAEAARQAGYLVARIAGTSDLTFNAFLREIFEEIATHVEETPAGGILNKQLGVERISDLIDPEVQDVQSALKAFSRISTQQVLVFVDDFHRIHDTEMKQKVSDLLATLHGTNASVSMVIAARSDDIDEIELFGNERPSGAITIRLDPMRPDEISTMLTSGGRRLGIRFGQDVLQAITMLCQGLPAVAQWMGLLTVQQVLRRYDDEVTLDDVVDAAPDAAVKTDRYVCELLDRALVSQSADRLDNLLFLAALSSTTQAPELSPDDINRTAARTGEPPYTGQGLHRLLTKHCKGKNAIFERATSPEGTCYRFADPLTRSIILLRNASRQQPSGTDVLTAYLEHQQQPLLGTESDPFDEFLRWLRFVLIPEDVELYNSWAQQDPAASHEFCKQFRRAHDDHVLEVLLCEIQSVLKNASQEPQASSTRDAA